MKIMNEILHEFKSTPPREVWMDGILLNFIYGYLGAMVVVAVNLRIDAAVLLSYLIFYFFLGKIVNRPRYVTNLGKWILFPIPTSLGAFTGYKIAPLLINLIQQHG